jgi:SAM-dependent methyltransferase
MAATNTATTDSMPAIRDRYFAPGQLCPSADDMARRLSRISTGPLLETSADTGTLTQALASAMSAGVTIIATDPEAEMVGHASLKFGMARVTWQTADPSALPFPDHSFGIVVCHLGVPTLPDRIRAFRETRRVLKSNGRFVFGVPAHIRHNPVADCLHEAMQGLFPIDPPLFVGHTLHGYADSEAIDDDLTAAGFTDAIYTSVDLPCFVPSARDAAMGYCLGTPLRSEIQSRAPGEMERIITSATIALERHFGPGPIESSLRTLVISASG